MEKNNSEMKLYFVYIKKLNKALMGCKQQAVLLFFIFN